MKFTALDFILGNPLPNYKGDAYIDSFNKYKYLLTEYHSWRFEKYGK